MNYDVSAFSGHWPFRHLRRSSLPELLDESAQLGISGGWMSSLDAIFYNDPWEADELLLDALTGTGWKLAMCANPRLPWMEDTVCHAGRLGVRCLRLYPGIHRYRPQEAESLCRLAGELGMCVILTGRMEDERLCYLLEQQRVRVDECAELAKEFPDVPFLLSGFYLSELSCPEAIADNLWTDTAGLCHGLEPIRALIESGYPRERIVFGSLAPLQSVHSHLLNIPREEQTAILSANPKRLLEVTHDRL